MLLRNGRLRPAKPPGTANTILCILRWSRKELPYRLLCLDHEGVCTVSRPQGRRARVHVANSWALSRSGKANIRYRHVCSQVALPQCPFYMRLEAAVFAAHRALLFPKAAVPTRTPALAPCTSLARHCPASCLQGP